MDIISSSTNIAWPPGWWNRSKISIFLTDCIWIGDGRRLRDNIVSILKHRDIEQMTFSWKLQPFELRNIIPVFKAMQKFSRLPNYYYYPYDSFSLLCITQYRYPIIDDDVLNEIFRILISELFNEKDFLTNLLLTGDDIPCIELPLEFIRWTFIDFFKFVEQEKKKMSIIFSK